MAKDGTLTATDNGYTLRFERELEHPVDKVWAALTDPAHMKDWLSDQAEVDLRVGGNVTFHDHRINSKITALDPPKLLAFGWNGPDWEGGVVTWELSRTNNGTRLVLSHEMPAMSDEEAEQFRKDHPGLPEGWAPVPSTLAGWHSILDRLAPVLDGKPIPSDMSHWRTLHEHYAESVRVYVLIGSPAGETTYQKPPMP